MVPLRDNNPTQIPPYITYTLIAINVLVFLHEISLSPQELEQFFRTYAIVPRELTTSLRSGNLEQMIPNLLTLVTSQFLHGGFLHLAGNMLFLFAVAVFWIGTYLIITLLPLLVLLLHPVPEGRSFWTEFSVALGWRSLRALRV